MKCSNCNLESADIDVYYGYGEMFHLCHECTPDYDFFIRVIESMDKRNQHLENECQKYIKRCADLKIELSTIQNAVNQAVERMK